MPDQIVLPGSSFASQYKNFKRNYKCDNQNTDISESIVSLGER